MRRTPLAWCNLLHDLPKSLVAVTGVSFALTAIFMQAGFLQSVLRTATLVTDKFDYDLILTSENYLYLAEPGSLRRAYLELAKAAPGVRDVAPIYVGTTTWRNDARVPGAAEAAVDRERRRPLLVLGFDLSDDPFVARDGDFRASEVAACRDALKETNAVLVDRRCRGEYGPLAVGIRPEIGLRRFRVVGLFTMGTGFAADGAIIVGDQTFGRLCGRDTLARPNLGLVQLEPGADPAAVARRLGAILPETDVRVSTRSEFRNAERRYWVVGKSIGVIFAIGASVAFLVGVMVVYQVLSSDIADHFAEYATLKAMGYSVRDLATVLLQEGLIIAVAAYTPSLLIAWALYALVRRGAVIPIDMSPWIAGPLVVLALTMCALSALVSLRKVVRADPADLY
jgi:putative ABC transport system permease protein